MKLQSAKRLWIYALVASVIFTLILGGITVAFIAYQQERTESSAEKIMRSYADELKKADADELEGMTSAATVVNYDYLTRPDVKVVVYKRRADMTVNPLTADPFLTKNTPEFNQRFDQITSEKIGGYNFLTYAFQARDGYYVKLLTPSETFVYAERLSEFGIYSSSILLVCFGVYLLFAYIQARPIYDAIDKQRNFINEMSHEIRTPLTIIKGNIENIMACPDSRIIDVSEQLDNTVTEVEHITALSHDLLNIISPVRSAAMKKKDHTIGDTVSSVLEIYSDIISDSNRTLIANIGNVTAFCDTEKIKQLLIILLDNAVKYTREGDKIKVVLRSADNGFELVVSDTGIGVADGDEEKIFDRFYRGENAKAQQGNGLGLAIAKSIVDNHGGKISAARNIPSGLVISVFIPNK